MNRRQSRNNAFILVFESLFLNTTAEHLIKSAKELQNLELDDYAEKIVFGVLENRLILDKKIELYLKNWVISRIPKVLLSILEISFYEILFVKSVDGPVSINEAVELSKNYFGGDGPSFVNGVLGNFLKSI